jgi:hypothetical protein
MPQSRRRKAEYMRGYMRRKRGLGGLGGESEGGDSVSPFVSVLVPTREGRGVSPWRGRAFLGTKVTVTQERMLEALGIPVDFRGSDHILLLRDGLAVDLATGQVVVDSGDRVSELEARIEALHDALEQVLAHLRAAEAIVGEHRPATSCPGDLVSVDKLLEHRYPGTVQSGK